MKWELTVQTGDLLTTPVVPLPHPFPVDASASLNITTVNLASRSSNSKNLNNRDTSNSDSFIDVSSDKKECFSLLLQRAMIADEDGDRALHIAVSYIDVQLVKILCFIMTKGGASLDVNNHLRQTPLHIAVVVGNPKVVKILLHHGASARCQNRHGYNSIHLAVRYFNENVFSCLLLKAGIDALNAFDHEGFTPLQHAVKRCNVIAIKRLSETGADVDAADGKSGRSALIHAVLAGHLDMVILLLNECHATIAKTDYSGQTALDFALLMGNRNIIQFLEKKTGKTSFTADQISRPVKSNKKRKSVAPSVKRKRNKT